MGGKGKYIYLWTMSIIIGIIFFNTVDKKEINIIRKDNSSEKLFEITNKISNNRKEVNKKININIADEKELEKLYKVGPKIAERIIDYRNKNGKFKKIEDIAQVKGIGPKMYDKIKESIVVE